MDPLRHLRVELNRLDADGLLRVPAQLPEGTLVLCSNDYLGYAAITFAAGEAPSGAGASRLVSGDRFEHRDAERALATWTGAQDALLLSSGYAANVGLIAALADDDDVVVSDALNHASIIDGCRLSRARVQITPHLDLEAVEHQLRSASSAQRRWVITESYFSMSGDSPDLATLREICDRHDAALIVDEAHALGVFGPRGAGLCAATGMRADVLIGTLGKAVGLQGAFVAGSQTLRSWLWNRLRSLVFSTAVSPWLAAATRQRVASVADDEAARQRLREHVDRFRQALHARAAPIATSHGPIIPWMVGDERLAVSMSAALLERGIFVQAIRAPTVAAGSARLRITLRASLTDKQLDRALAAFADLCC